MEQEIYEIDKLVILNCDELEFVREDSGFINLNYKGNVYNKINITRLIPFYSKTQYISISYENEEKEFREIGVIKDTNELKEHQRKLVENYLEFKYYMPEIKKVYSIKDNLMGYIFVSVDTTSGKKTLKIKDWYANFRMLTKDYLYAIDVDGNKYFCPNVNNLDKKSVSIIELFI